MTLAEDCYRLSAAFPVEERFGLPSQLRLCAVSIPSNIAEGFGRGQTNGFLQYLHIAQGSLREAETRIALAVSLKLGAPDATSAATACAVRVSNMLLALIRSLEHRRSSAS